MAWLLGTNVLSELRRLKPEPKVVDFVAGQPLGELYISAVTLAEIRFGIGLVTESKRRVELNDWLTHRVRPMFDQRVLPVTEDIMLQWRLLVENRNFHAALRDLERLKKEELIQPSPERVESVELECLSNGVVLGLVGMTVVS